jgi:hypothetical protein
MEEDGHEFPDEYESPAPVHLPGGRAVPSEPCASHHREPPEVVDVFGAEEATTALVERLEAVSPSSPPGHRSCSRRRTHPSAIESMGPLAHRPRSSFGYSSSPAAGLVRASRDVVARRPDLFGRTAASVVTYWPGGIRAGVEVAVAPCPGIRVR